MIEKKSTTRNLAHARINRPFLENKERCVPGARAGETLGRLVHREIRSCQNEIQSTMKHVSCSHGKELFNNFR